MGVITESLMEKKTVMKLSRVNFTTPVTSSRMILGHHKWLVLVVVLL